MNERFDKAISDLYAWREYRDVVVAQHPDSPHLNSVVRAIDGALKGEVLERRIRTAVSSQIATEAEASGVDRSETETARHRWDIDWWLTESTLRALHASIDGLAQLLNVAFGLGEDSDDPGLPKAVVQALAKDSELAGLRKAVSDFWESEPCRSVSAFVNHIKHVGWPGRMMYREQDLEDYPRLTGVGSFRYCGTEYGPWSPGEIDELIDRFRAGLLGVMAAAQSAGRA